MRSRSWGFTAAFVLLVIGGAVLVLLSTRSPRATTSPTPIMTLPPTPAPTVPLLPSPVLPTPTPGPLLYTIQEGDTLFSIALAHGVTLDELIEANGLSDPNLIHPGQTIIIPGRTAPIPVGTEAPGSPLPTPLPRPALPSPTPSGPPLVEIASVLGAGDIENEVVRVRNRGGAAWLEGWTLSNARGAVFTFPRLVLFTGAEVEVHTATGISSPTALYWGRAAPAWDSGELLTLRDAAGEVVDSYIVP